MANLARLFFWIKILLAFFTFSFFIAIGNIYDYYNDKLLSSFAVSGKIDDISISPLFIK